MVHLEKGYLFYFPEFKIMSTEDNGASKQETDSLWSQTFNSQLELKPILKLMNKALLIKLHSHVLQMKSFFLIKFPLQTKLFSLSQPFVFARLKNAAELQVTVSAISPAGWNHSSKN